LAAAAVEAAAALAESLFAVLKAANVEV